jgi:hypothetical protein
MFVQLKKTLIYISILSIAFPVTSSGGQAQPASSAVSVSAVTVTVDTNPQTGKIFLSSHINSKTCALDVQNTLSIVQDESVVNLHQGSVCDTNIAIAPVVVQANLIVAEPVNVQEVKVVVHQAELNTIKVKTSHDPVHVAVLPTQVNGIEANIKLPILRVVTETQLDSNQSYSYTLNFDQLHVLRC